MNTLTSKTLQLNIISPERLVVQDTVHYVVLPGFHGECAILPGHAHFLLQLSAGEIRIIKEDQTEFLAISGGFAEVHPDRVEVFAETAELAKEIDAERAKQAAERAKQQLSQDISPEEAAKIETALRRALIRLRVSQGSKRHK